MGVEDIRRLRLSGHQERCRARRIWERDRVPEAVREENLRHGKANIIGSELQNAASVGLVRIRHVVLQMHDPLRSPGRAGGVHPKRHFVAMGVRRVQLVRERRKPRARRYRADRDGAAGFPVHDDQRLQQGVGAGRRAKSIAEGRFGDRDLRAGVGEIELQQIGRRQQIDQERRESSPHRGKECRRIDRRIVEKQEYAVTTNEAERQEGVAPTSGIGAQLGEGSPTGRPGHGKTVASAVRKVAKQNITRVVALGYFEIDLPRSRPIGRHRIGNSARGRRLHHGRTSTAEAGYAAS